MPTVAEYRELENKVIRMEEKCKKLDRIEKEHNKMLHMTSDLLVENRGLRRESRNHQRHINELAGENAELLDKTEDFEKTIERLRQTILNMALDRHGPPPPYSRSETQPDSDPVPDFDLEEDAYDPDRTATCDSDSDSCACMACSECCMDSDEEQE